MGINASLPFNKILHKTWCGLLNYFKISPSSSDSFIMVKPNNEIGAEAAANFLKSFSNNHISFCTSL
jgi:hypothetical protein